MEYTYGRPSNPTTRALELALAKLEGGQQTFLTPSGLCAVSTTLLAFAETGGHILISDSVYQPTRRFANRVLKRLGVDIEYYDPLIAGGNCGPSETRNEARLHGIPGSQTFKSKIFPRSAKRRKGVAFPSPSTIRGPHRFISAPSTTA